MTVIAPKTLTCFVACDDKQAKAIVATARLRQIPCHQHALGGRSGVMLPDVTLIKSMGLRMERVADVMTVVPKRPRDSQRSKVWGWMQATLHKTPPPYPDLIPKGHPGYWENASFYEWHQRMWSAECRRYGHVGAEKTGCSPDWRMESNLRGAAHRLTWDSAMHGPRFVAVYMGLLCRYAGYDVHELKAKAEEMKVKYHTRPIGSVPNKQPLTTLTPATIGEPA